MTRRFLIGVSAVVLAVAFVLVESPARAWDGDDVTSRRPRQSDSWGGYGGNDGASRPRPRPRPSDDWGTSTSRYPDRDRYPSRDRYPDRYGSDDRYDRYPDRRHGDGCRYGDCRSDHGTVYRPNRDDRDDNYGGRPSRESSSTYGGSESSSTRPRPRPRPSDDWGGSGSKQSSSDWGGGSSGKPWGAGGTGYGGNGGR